MKITNKKWLAMSTQEKLIAVYVASKGVKPCLAK